MSRHELSFLNGLSDDDRILLSKLLDWNEAAEEKYITRFSSFLDERQCSLAEKALKSVRAQNYRFFGGYDGAERKMLCIYAPYSEINDSDFPMKAIEISFRGEVGLSHRDILGSLMALKITRDCIGDILVEKGRAVVFLKDIAADEALMSVRKIGRTGVKLALCDRPVQPPEIQYKEINGTVASLRLDCVTALAIRQSREKTAALIRSGLVQTDHEITESPAKMIEEGDVISVRGYGKFLLRSVNGTTAKDRIHITVCKYI